MNYRGRFLLLALFWLALGISADLWVVIRKILQSDMIVNLIGGMTLLFFYPLWFGYSVRKRRQKTCLDAEKRSVA